MRGPLLALLLALLLVTECASRRNWEGIVLTGSVAVPAGGRIELARNFTVRNFAWVSVDCWVDSDAPIDVAVHRDGGALAQASHCNVTSAHIERRFRVGAKGRWLFVIESVACAALVAVNCDIVAGDGGDPVFNALRMWIFVICIVVGIIVLWCIANCCRECYDAWRTKRYTPVAGP